MLQFCKVARSPTASLQVKLALLAGVVKVVKVLKVGSSPGSLVRLARKERVGSRDGGR